MYISTLTAALCTYIRVAKSLDVHPQWMDQENVLQRHNVKSLAINKMKPWPVEKMDRTRDRVKQSNPGSETQILHVFYHMLSMWLCVYMCKYVSASVCLPIGLESEKETLNEWRKVFGVWE